MANISEYNTVTTNTLLANAINYKSNPALMQQAIYNYLQGITNGQVDIVDPTNPFVFLVEASVVNAAAAMLESNIALQRQYVSLARTAKDLYLHMSNSEYIDVFSTPANGTFTFLLNRQDIIRNAVPVPGESYSKVVIPANSYTTVGNYTFTLLYPIEILYYNNGTILVQIDPSRPNPLQVIGSFIINHAEVTDSNGTEWIQFQYNIDQFVITSEQYALVANTYFQETIPFSNLFYYCRVFYLDENTLDWVAINTTYTDQVFDPYTPTALIQILNGEIQVNIPQIYLDNGLIQSNIRIDVYTTLGEIDVNMAGFNAAQYSNVFTAVNQYEIDGNPYVEAMANVSYLWYSTDVISGGSNAISFNQLRDIKVNNALNGRLLPITNAQAVQYASFQGFTLVPNIDVVTNRQFKAIAAPPPSNSSIVPSLNTTVASVLINLANISTDNKVIVHNSTIIITPETVFINQNGQITFITQSQRASLVKLSNSDLVDNFNTTQYLYTPFYYMIDNSTSRLITRAYWLNSPSMQNLNYISNNPTSGHKVSTNSFAITKMPSNTFSGYLITLVCDADSAFLKLNPKDVFCQLAFRNNVTGTYAYMTVNANATLASNGGFSFSFYISSNYFLDIENTLDLDSFSMPALPNQTVRSPLTQTFNILYGQNSTPSGFVANNAQLNIFNANQVSANASVITHETIEVTFGTYLSNLWIKSSLFIGQPTYLTYQTDVPLLYSKDEYEVDPLTGCNFTIQNGKIVYNLLHAAGDPVLNSDGTPVYAHYAGDLVLDANNNPFVLSEGITNYTLDMVFYDGAYRIATDPNVTNYVQTATDTLAEWASTTMSQLDNSFFERTTLKYSPPTSIGSIACEVDGLSNVVLNSNLSPTISIYLSVKDYANTNLKTQLQTVVINILHQYLTNTVLSKSDLINTLEKTIVNALAISVSGFFDNYGIVVIKDPQYRFSLERINYLESNNVIGVKENVSIIYYKVATNN